MEQLPADLSPFTLHQLTTALDSARIQTLKPRTYKGVYLVSGSQEAEGCFISRLPNNLIRLLISYNTISELLSFTFTCKRFGQFLFDKYIAFSGEYGNVGFFKQDRFTFQDHYDLIRAQELSSQGYRVKIYASLRPEFTSLFHINTKKETFYSYHNGEIQEGELVRYNDSLALKCTRPCISNASAWDVCGEVIVCASSSEIALSRPAQPLRVARFPHEEAAGAVRLLGEKRLIVVQRQGRFETWSELLQPLGHIAHEGGIVVLQVADFKRMIFAAQSVSGFVTAYQVDFAGNIRKLWQWTNEFGQSRVKSFHLADIRGELVLIILTITGALYANRTQISKPTEVWTHFSVLNDKLFAGSANNLFLFTYNSQSGQYKSKQKLKVRCEPWSDHFSYINYSRMKGIAVFQTDFGHQVVFFRPSHNAISVFSTITLPRIADFSVQSHKEVTVLKGSIVEEREGQVWSVPCVYVLNFNVNSMLVRMPDLVQQARTWVDEKVAEVVRKRLKRAELKRKEQSEKAKKTEEREQKHRPKR